MDKRERPRQKPAITPPGKDELILVTGAGGFIGRNLICRLRAEGYTRVEGIDLGSPEGALEAAAKEAAFVFHLAGVNRPKDPGEFYSGNADLTRRLTGLLAAAGRGAPLLLSSSAQAGNGSDYAISKEQAEEAVFEYGDGNGGLVFVYRLPGVFGKWSRPAYNSVVATFCHNIARGEPIEIRDAEADVHLCYIDDVVDSFLGVLQGRGSPAPRGLFFSIQPVYHVKLGRLAELLVSFREGRSGLSVPDVCDDFTRKLYATYLSYLPEDGFAAPLKGHRDERGAFTELLRDERFGQISVNVTKPGYTKGNHWHDTKNEKFLVLAGEGVIRFRRMGQSEVIEYRVTGEEPRWVDIPPGYTHNIENLGAGDLITLMWASEVFDPEHPDTWREEV